MLRALMLILSLAFAGSAFAHSDSKWTKGPQGGHIVDAGGGKQHWELVAKGNELVLYVLDANEQPVNVDGSGAKGQAYSLAKPTTLTSNRRAATRSKPLATSPPPRACG